MSEDGQLAMQVILQMKRLYEETSVLLRTADRCMEKSGWKSLGGTAAVGGSTHIEWPAFWLPQDVYRFYQKDEQKHVLAFISVVLFDRESAYVMDETEPKSLDALEEKIKGLL